MQLTFALSTLALLLPILQVTAAPQKAGTLPRLTPVKVQPKKTAAAAQPVSTASVFRGRKGGNRGNQNQNGNQGANAGNGGANAGGNNGANAGGNAGSNGNNANAGNNGNNANAGNNGNNANAGNGNGNNANAGNGNGNNANAGNGGNKPINQLTAQELQSVNELSPDLVQPGSARTGQEDPTPGQVESLTSTNNFINYCATKPNVPLTNGQQIFAGSCNGIIMGEIMAKDKMPSAMVLFPKNGATLQEGEDINFQVKVRNIQTGSFTNAQLTYYAAPQQLNDNGILIGHQHITVNAIDSLDDTEPKDPQDFVFFKGLNDPADNNGVMSAVAAGGLKAGTYRACTLGSSANHTPIIPPVAQRASTEDCIRFTVTAGGNGGNNGGNNANAGNGGNNAGAGNGGNNANAGNGGNNGQQGNNNGQQQGNNGQGQGQGRGQGRGRGGRGRGGQQFAAQPVKSAKPKSGRRSFSSASRSRIARK